MQHFFTRVSAVARLIQRTEGQTTELVDRQDVRGVAKGAEPAEPLQAGEDAVQIDEEPAEDHHHHEDENDDDQRNNCKEKERRWRRKERRTLTEDRNGRGDEETRG